MPINMANAKNNMDSAGKVRAGEELDLSALNPWLLEQLSDIKGTPEVTQYSGGASNWTYCLSYPEKEVVLRRAPLGTKAKGAHDMGREYKVLSGLNKGFDKAPKVYAYTEDEAVLGVPFYVMEKVEGIIIDYKEAKKRSISKTEFPVIADTWLDTLVELHNFDYEAVGLGDLGRPNGYVERQVRNWSKQYLKAATDDIPEAEKVMKWLDRNQPTKYDLSLIHNDFKYDNVVFEDDSWKKISAVLDWEMCTLGVPLMDLGAAVAYWATADDHPMILKAFPFPTIFEGNPSRMELVEEYAQKSGRSINKLVFYYAFGLFKNAVIVQQIYYRYHKGMTSNEKFANLNMVTRLFLTIAWQAIQKKKIEGLF